MFRHFLSNPSRPAIIHGRQWCVPRKNVFVPIPPWTNALLSNCSLDCKKRRYLQHPTGPQPCETDSVVFLSPTKHSQHKRSRKQVPMHSPVRVVRIIDAKSREHGEGIANHLNGTTWAPSVLCPAKKKHVCSRTLGATCPRWKRNWARSPSIVRWSFPAFYCFLVVSVQ